jgi:hypothetical protein
MTRPSERELRRAVESVVDSAGETAAQDYVDGLLAGWTSRSGRCRRGLMTRQS